ncbi:uncharacterized protein [Dermacentor albipictus]|uniref:uncharacterized protein n=1 Tax=Dermacentor albipictus TaxID=60249 RepID=UPI0038FC766E
MPRVGHRLQALDLGKTVITQLLPELQLKVLHLVAMSDWSDSTEAADSDTREILPWFSRPWDEMGAGNRAKPDDSSPWMWYYNLSAKQRRAVDERITNKLAAKAAEFRDGRRGRVHLRAVRVPPARQLAEPQRSAAKVAPRAGEQHGRPGFSRSVNQQGGPPRAAS